MKNKNLFLFAALGLLVLPSLSACSSSEEGTTLRVLNMEDYIYLYEEGAEAEPEDQMDLIDQFARDMEKEHPEMGKIKVIYTTTDTNETLYNEIKTGKAVYDVICPSDYMIQKLIIDDLIEPLNKSLVPNYYGADSEVCADIKNRFGGIEATKLKTKETVKLDDYSVGYMWGTLGILYNPEFQTFVDNELNEQIHDDVREWDMLWNEAYEGTISIKNSMRDTYAVGIMKAYEDKLKGYKANPGEGHTYTDRLFEVFNSFEQEDVDAVEKALKELKQNIFGLEVDSGKLDIATGKIGVNVAWSGDAVYSMELAEGYGKDLYYAIPELGSNIWFDGWVMPKRPTNQQRSENETVLAHEWLNYLCSPHVAKENMEYTGYTSFVGGEEVRDIVRDWYDARTDFMYFADEDEESGETTYREVFYEDGEEEVLVEYEDFELDAHQKEDEESEEEHNAKEARPLYYYDANEEKQVFNNPYEEDPTPLTYGDLTIEKLCSYDDVKPVELQYFFGNNPYDYTFYSSLYLPFEGNDWAGLDFFCQFPSEETIERCAVMAYDYLNNDRVVKMWEDFKSDPLPTWAIVLFAVEGAAAIGLIAYFTFGKYVKRSLRKKRKEEQDKK